MARSWLKTCAHIWEGKKDICWRGAFDFIHDHGPKGANGEEPTVIRCTQQEEDNLWERLRDAIAKRTEEEEASVAKAIEELRGEASA
eukprot:11798262-Heterocapsa_arctica.AAC.1